MESGEFAKVVRPNDVQPRQFSLRRVKPGPFAMGGKSYKGRRAANAKGTQSSWTWSGTWGKRSYRTTAWTSYDRIMPKAAASSLKGGELSGMVVW